MLKLAANLFSPVGGQVFLIFAWPPGGEESLLSLLPSGGLVTHLVELSSALQLLLSEELAELDSWLLDERSVNNTKKTGVSKLSRLLVISPVMHLIECFWLLVGP